ncbi:MAG: hypothetical protein ABEJ85_05800 [Haloarculaceae archaeon]
MTPSLPDEWHEVADPGAIVEKYRAHNPTLFVREGHDVGVHVLPTATSSPHDEERYRVGAIRGNEDDFEYERAVATLEEREPALELALDFATRYEDLYAERGDETAALEVAVERVSSP